MTSRLLRTAPFALLFVLVTSAIAGKHGAPAPAEQIDKIFSAIVADQFAGAAVPGTAIMVRKGGRTIFQRGYGVRDSRAHSLSQIDSRTNFRLASCTKQFTAMAVMLLVHDGKLRYEERLTEIFPEFPAYGNSITVRDLLNHTSGLPDYEDLMDVAMSRKLQAWSETKQIRDAEVLTLLEAEKSGKFLPGTKWSYSNSGYVVLGLIVGKVSGEPFADFLQDYIFKPLKMDHTLAYVKGKNEISDRAYGHAKDGDAFKQTDQSSTSATLGDGGVYSNLEDLALWDSALIHNRLLSEAEMKPALVPVRLPDGSLPLWAGDPGDSDPQGGKPISYGFGWFLDSYKGHARMWHFGDTVGFKSAIERFKADDLTIVLLCNRSDLDAAALAAKVAEIYLK